MGFTDEQNQYYIKASTRLIRKQIFELMKKIPVAKLQQIDANKPDTEMTRRILQQYLTESEFVEYSIWAWLLTKIPEMKNNQT